MNTDTLKDNHGWPGCCCTLPNQPELTGTPETLTSKPLQPQVFAHQVGPLHGRQAADSLDTRSLGAATSGDVERRAGHRAVANGL